MGHILEGVAYGMAYIDEWEPVTKKQKHKPITKGLFKDKEDIVAKIDNEIEEYKKEEKCPHCNNGWHENRLTSGLLQLYKQRTIDASYFMGRDTSQVICEGSTFIGPQRPPVRYIRPAPVATFTTTTYKSPGVYPKMTEEIGWNGAPTYSYDTYTLDFGDHVPPGIFTHNSIKHEDLKWQIHEIYAGTETNYKPVARVTAKTGNTIMKFSGVPFDPSMKNSIDFDTKALFDTINKGYPEGYPNDPSATIDATYNPITNVMTSATGYSFSPPTNTSIITSTA